MSCSPWLDVYCPERGCKSIFVGAIYPWFSAVCGGKSTKIGKYKINFQTVYSIEYKLKGFRCRSCKTLIFFVAKYSSNPQNTAQPASKWPKRRPSLSMATARNESDARINGEESLTLCTGKFFRTFQCVWESWSLFDADTKLVVKKVAPTAAFNNHIHRIYNNNVLY